MKLTDTSQPPRLTILVAMMFATTRNVVKAIASTASGIVPSHQDGLTRKIAGVYPFAVP